MLIKVLTSKIKSSGKPDDATDAEPALRVDEMQSPVVGWLIAEVHVME